MPHRATSPRQLSPRNSQRLCAGTIANSEVPGSIAVGGTICALYAGHRASYDVDFVLPDLASRFDDVREHLLSLPAWKESRVRPPKMILGQLNDVQIGYRQQIRPAPIETQTIATPDGTLVVPTLDELIRIKSVLAYDRNAMRDFIDLAELAALAGHDRSVAAWNQSVKSMRQPNSRRLRWKSRRRWPVRSRRTRRLMAIRPSGFCRLG